MLIPHLTPVFSTSIFSTSFINGCHVFPVQFSIELKAKPNTVTPVAGINSHDREKGHVLAHQYITLPFNIHPWRWILWNIEAWIACNNSYWSRAPSQILPVITDSASRLFNIRTSSKKPASHRHLTFINIMYPSFGFYNYGSGLFLLYRNNTDYYLLLQVTTGRVVKTVAYMCIHFSTSFFFPSLFFYVMDSPSVGS